MGLMVVDSKGVTEVVPIAAVQLPAAQPIVVTSFSWVTVRKGNVTWERLVVERTARF